MPGSHTNMNNWTYKVLRDRITTGAPYDSIVGGVHNALSINCHIDWSKLKCSLRASAVNCGDGSEQISPCAATHKRGRLSHRRYFAYQTVEIISNVNGPTAINCNTVGIIELDLRTNAIGQS